MLCRFWLISVILGLHLLSIDGKKNEDPSCKQDVFDNCCNRMLMIGDPTFVFPTNAEQMNNRCK